MAADKLTLTVAECARLLGLSRGGTYEAIRRREIPSLRIGARILIPRAALMKMLDGQVQGESHAGQHTP